MVRGYLYHLQLTLRHNFASRQAMVYGYLVPIFFLIAFGAVFRSVIPPLVHQMGQLLTISALGGACFGLPTALVADRERGLWRRYRLLPRATVPLISSILCARFLLIASAGVMQILLARAIFGTPFPAHPLLLAGAYLFVAVAFLGLGLLIAALAEDVPAVQALGQCVFLPMIMIGGVGVPLAALPAWAQRLAGFFPGRYAVDSLQAGFSGERGSLSLTYNLAALLAIGVGAGLAGARLFRWDSSHRPARGARLWVALAVLPWIAVGAGALASGRWRPTGGKAADLQSLTAADFESIHYEGLPPDDGTVTPLAASLDNLEPAQAARMKILAAQLEWWPPGQVSDSTEAVRNLLGVAAIFDLREDPLEGAIARLVVNRLTHFPPDQLRRNLAWIVLHPDQGTVLTALPDLGFPEELDRDAVRERITLYAVKVLARLRGLPADSAR